MTAREHDYDGTGTCRRCSHDYLSSWSLCNAPDPPKKLTFEEMLRWIADLGCEIAPNVCGTCIACRAQAQSPDYEVCPGSGGEREESCRCSSCDETIYGTSEGADLPVVVPVHWRLKESK